MLGVCGCGVHLWVWLYLFLFICLFVCVFLLLLLLLVLLLLFSFVFFYLRFSLFSVLLFCSENGGHDFINNFEFLCSSIKNPLSISNFTYTVKTDVKSYENFQSVGVGHLTSYRYRFLFFFCFFPFFLRRLLAFCTRINRVTEYLDGIKYICLKK